MGGEQYKPNPTVLGRLKQVHFVAVVGPTASGKSTLIKAAVQRDPSLHLVMNNTSRAIRTDEQEGIEYYFHTREEMLARMEKGEYVQVAPTILGDLYATAPENYRTEGISLLPVLAEAVPIFAALPFASFSTVFVLPPNYEVWMERARSHHFTPEQKAKRLGEAARSLHFAIENPDMPLVINGDLQSAIEGFIRRAKALPLTVEERDKQQEARRLAIDLLDHLKKELL